MGTVLRNVNSPYVKVATNVGRIISMIRLAI